MDIYSHTDSKNKSQMFTFNSDGFEMT